jgi:HK97 family phage portal protein
LHGTIIYETPTYKLKNNRFSSNEQFNSPFASPQMGMKAFNPFEEFRLEGVSSRERAELYAYSAMVYQATNLRASSVSQVPMRVKDPNGEIITEGLLARMFNRRSGYVDKMRRAETSVCTFGYNLFYKARNGMGIPVDLQWLNPTNYMVDADNYRGLKGFRITTGLAQSETGGVYLEPENAVYMNTVDLLDDYDGVSPTEVAFASASADVEIAETIHAVFRNMAIPATFVQPASDSRVLHTQENVDVLTRLFRTITQGARNVGRTLVSPQRWDFVTLQPPFRDMDTRHLTDQVREQVAIAFGIPIELLFASASGYAQFEGVRRSWAHTWLVPHVWWYADAFTDQLANEFGAGYTVEPDLDSVPFLKEDMASRQNSVNSKLQMGLITYGEAQRQLGVEVIPATEKMVFSASLGAPVPVEQFATIWQKNTSPESQTPTPPQRDDDTHPLPDNHTIGVVGVRDTLAQLLRIVLGRSTRDIVILLRVPPDLLDRP